jgi:hypothetical protein
MQKYQASKVAAPGRPLERTGVKVHHIQSNTVNKIVRSMLPDADAHYPGTLAASKET